MYDTKGIKTDFGRAAGVYDTQAKLQQQVLAETIAAARAYWPDGACIADIGSGTGMLAEQAAQQGFKWNITACDIAYGMCIKTASRNVPVINGDVHQLPFASGSFDGVFSSLMLQWANDPQAALTEIARIMKPEGYAVLTTFTTGTLEELKEAFKAVDSQTHASEFESMNTLATYASSAGFSVKQLHEKTVVEHYHDTLQLMQAIRSIGASHKAAGRNRGLMTKNQLDKLEQAYRGRFHTPEGLPVTWKILRMIVRKKQGSN
jgi:malonyl-CoA O-methyltransferase